VGLFGTAIRVAGERVIGWVLNGGSANTANGVLRSATEHYWGQ
jgi:hypothetical protein